LILPRGLAKFADEESGKSEGSAGGEARPDQPRRGAPLRQAAGHGQHRLQINDRSVDPLLVFTGGLDAALTKALPRLLRGVRDLVGERRVTIVFDRGGWSPKLFSTMGPARHRDPERRGGPWQSSPRNVSTPTSSMVAYQAQSDLLALLRLHYARADQEGGEPCCMSCSPLQATSAFSVATRPTRAARPSAKCSTKPRQSSPALACGCASLHRYRFPGSPFELSAATGYPGP
jgi:hypothetical protein